MHGQKLQRRCASAPHHPNEPRLNLPSCGDFRSGLFVLGFNMRERLPLLFLIITITTVKLVIAVVSTTNVAFLFLRLTATTLLLIAPAPPKHFSRNCSSHSSHQPLETGTPLKAVTSHLLTPTPVTSFRTGPVKDTGDK